MYSVWLNSHMLDTKWRDNLGLQGQFEKLPLLVQHANRAKSDAMRSIDSKKRTPINVCGTLSALVRTTKTLARKTLCPLKRSCIVRAAFLRKGGSFISNRDQVATFSQKQIWNTRIGERGNILSFGRSYSLTCESGSCGTSNSADID